MECRLCECGVQAHAYSCPAIRWVRRNRQANCCSVAEETCALRMNTASAEPRCSCCSASAASTFIGAAAFWLNRRSHRAPTGISVQPGVVLRVERHRRRRAESAVPGGRTLHGRDRGWRSVPGSCRFVPLRRSTESSTAWSWRLPTSSSRCRGWDYAIALTQQSQPVRRRGLARAVVDRCNRRIASSSYCAVTYRRRRGGWQDRIDDARAALRVFTGATEHAADSNDDVVASASKSAQTANVVQRLRLPPYRQRLIMLGVLAYVTEPVEDIVTLRIVNTTSMISRCR